MVGGGADGGAGGFFALAFSKSSFIVLSRDCGGDPAWEDCEDLALVDGRGDLDVGNGQFMGGRRRRPDIFLNFPVCLRERTRLRERGGGCVMCID